MPSSASPLIVDTHPHIISADVEKYPLKPLDGKRSDWSKARHDAPFEQLIEQLDAADIARAAIVQSSTTYGHDNSYVADSVDRSGGRITGVCSVGFSDPDALDSIQYWIKERGMSGLRIFTAGTTGADVGRLADPLARPAWQHASDHGIPVCVQTNMDGVRVLRGVLEDFPDLIVVLDHIAMSDFFEGPPYSVIDPVFELSDFAHLNLKVTTRTLRSAAQSAGGAVGAVQELVARFGSERLVWGSNWPSSDVDLPALTQLLRDVLTELPESDAANLAGRTALRLYPVLADGLGESDR